VKVPRAKFLATLKQISRTIPDLGVNDEIPYANMSRAVVNGGGSLHNILMLFG
jgi:hypothetical protein